MLAKQLLDQPLSPRSVARIQVDYVVLRVRIQVLLGGLATSINASSKLFPPLSLLPSRKAQRGRSYRNGTLVGVGDMASANRQPELMRFFGTILY